MNKQHFKNVFFAIFSLLAVKMHASTITTLNKNDPAPLYTSYQPNNFLITHQRENIKGYECFDFEEHVGFSVSPFHQKAKSGRDWDGNRVKLGDLEGRWHMLGLLYSCTTNDALENKYQNQLPTLEQACQKIFEQNAPVTDMSKIVSDPNKEFGFFSVPLRYRKTGVRFAFHARPGDFGISLYGGIAEIKQTVTCLINKTPNTPIYETLPGSSSDSCMVDPACCPIITVSACLVNDCLMTKSTSNKIFRELGYPDDICDFRSTQAEDLHFQAWWRHAFPVNQYEPIDDCGCYYPRFLFIPFITLNATIPMSKKKDRTKLWSLPHGNDQHAAIGGNAGFSFDFYETLEIGIEGGMMQFLPQTYDRFFLPTHTEQWGIFPCSTKVKRKPGRNFHLGAMLNAYHFLCNLSAFVQFLFISHDEDKFEVCDKNVAQMFKPNVLECKTKWEVHVLNTGMYYDISPNATLGFSAQWPLRQKNAYRSTTFLGTVRVVY